MTEESKCIKKRWNTSVDKGDEERITIDCGITAIINAITAIINAITAIINAITAINAIINAMCPPLLSLSP
jgi:hypothetical protein